MAQVVQQVHQALQVVMVVLAHRFLTKIMVGYYQAVVVVVQASLRLRLQQVVMVEQVDLVVEVAVAVVLSQDKQQVLADLAEQVW